MDVQELKKESQQDKAEETGLDKRTYVFDVKVEICGEKKHGTFTNRILNNNQKLERDVFAARMRRGLAFDSFSPDARMRQEMIAHLLVSLDDDRPDWAKNIGEIDDVEVIAEIYAEVEKHEATFRRPRADQKSGPR